MASVCCNRPGRRSWSAIIGLPHEHLHGLIVAPSLHGERAKQAQYVRAVRLLRQGLPVDPFRLCQTARLVMFAPDLEGLVRWS